MTHGQGRQRLVALFVLGFMAFNFPLLALWDHDVWVWGLPLFPLALFVLWFGVIVCLALLVDTPRD